MTRPRHGRGWFFLLIHFAVAAAVYLCFKYFSPIEFAQRFGRNDGMIVPDEEIERPIAELSVDERMAHLRRGSLAARKWNDT